MYPHKAVNIDILFSGIGFCSFRLFYGVGVIASPMPNPPLFSSRLGTTHDGVVCYHYNYLKKLTILESASINNAMQANSVTGVLFWLIEGNQRKQKR